MASTYPGYYTTSHYITSLTYLPGYGSDFAAQSNTNLTNNPSLSFLNEVIILDFGKPTVQTQRVKKNKMNTYGASLFNSTIFTSTNDIASGVEQFIDSFVASFTSPTVSYSITIAVGTTNYGSQVTKAHGQAWGNMINSINIYISNKAVTDSRYQSIQAVGANDMETGWNSPSVTRSWVDGYRSTTNYQLCNFGDAGGMPQAPYGRTSYISGTGNNGWTLDDIWYVSDGGVNPFTNTRYSFSLPEIYTTSGTQAAQWFNLDLYSHQIYQQPLSIYGVLTENAADNTTNPPSGQNSGWNQLAGYIQSSNVTAADLANKPPFMQWATDISWALP
ncbi:hypothetical protein [Bacillus sp. EB600]|uniref:hypothetical protein n=1 Tax=Bacillus sp. EB600 TaxID=2806345 RepID=UPI002108B7D6|nr:hypothetical protein [Bacillus sp. EB600]MCQ6282640.1 hypothetical protein [Bacillus sp. EB600]